MDPEVRITLTIYRHRGKEAWPTCCNKEHHCPFLNTKKEPSIPHHEQNSSRETTNIGSKFFVYK